MDMNDEEFADTVVKTTLNLIKTYQQYGLNREQATERYAATVLNNTRNPAGREAGALAFETLWDVYYG